MNRKLSDEDRRAVDLFLDQGAKAAKDAVTKVVPPVSQKRMSAVKTVFNLLGQMPVEEPPVNLIERTMKRIDRSRGKQPAPAGIRRPVQAVPPA